MRGRSLVGPFTSAEHTAAWWARLGPKRHEVSALGTNKPNHNLQRLILLGSALLVSACQNEVPEYAGSASPTRPDPFENALVVSVPPGVDKAPVVLLLEGNGGSGGMHPTWGPFLNARGIAVVQIQSAKARGRRNWEGTGCGLQYAGDPRAVLQTLQTRADIDTTRFAIMGFSRGGTEALGGGRAFNGAARQPAAIFAFYPGCGGVCDTDWRHRAPQVPVHIFYGAADGWGSHQGTRSSCRRLAGGSIEYHEYPDAQHGFDAPWTGRFHAGGNSFVFGPEPSAAAAAQAVIADVLSKAWGQLK
jgi:dienelactone hydrolase